MEPGQREQNAALVAEMRALLEGFVEGRVDHAGLARSAGALGRPRRLWGDAGAVFDSLVAADDLAAQLEGLDGEYVVRKSDAYAYLTWLRRGGGVLADEEPLAGIALGHPAFADLVGVEPVRWWCSGLGWFWSVEFCSPATGRWFGAIGSLERPGAEIRRAIYDADSVAALADFIEAFDVRREQLQTRLDLDEVARRSDF